MERVMQNASKGFDDEYDHVKALKEKEKILRRGVMRIKDNMATPSFKSARDSSLREVL